MSLLQQVSQRFLEIAGNTMVVTTFECTGTRGEEDYIVVPGQYLSTVNMAVIQDLASSENITISGIENTIGNDGLRQGTCQVAITSTGTANAIYHLVTLIVRR